MTTRICHNCGKNYHNHLEYCPYCHALNIHYQEPQEKVKEEPRKGIEVHPCLKCGKVYDDNVEFCPYCHSVNRDYHPQTEIRAHKISASRVIKLICVGGIGLFLLVMLCGAISLCFYHPSSPNGSSFAENTQVMVNSQQQDSSSSSSAGYVQAVKTTAIPQTTVAITSTSPTLQSGNNDREFLNAIQSMVLEIEPIITGIHTTSRSDPTFATLGTRLSTSSQFWYNKITPMQVSSKFQDSKDAYLLSLLESAASGDAFAKGVWLYQNGSDETNLEARDDLLDAIQHMEKATNYLQIGQEKMPK